MRVKDLVDFDGVIAGPSCVPFSSVGKNAGFKDSRSDTFAWTVSSMVDQAQRPSGRLRFFIIENVTGIAKRKQGAEKTAKQEVQEYLVEKIGTSFAIWSWRVHTKSMGLPQLRVRWFICGRRKSMFELPQPDFKPNDLFIDSGLGLRTILVPNLPSQFCTLTPKMKENLQRYRNKVARTSIPEDTVCIADLTRVVDKVMPVQYRTDGNAMTLTCRNNYLWVCTPNSKCEF